MAGRIATRLVFLASLFVSQAVAEEILVDVHGMTCPFCVDAVQRNLRKLDGVEKVEVSLQHKKVRIYATQKIDLEQVRRVVLDSGFTPL